MPKSREEDIIKRKIAFKGQNLFGQSSAKLSSPEVMKLTFSVDLPLAL